MTNPTADEKACEPRDWNVHGTRIRAYEDFERERLEEAAGKQAALAAAQAEFAAAARRYSESLHALRESVHGVDQTSPVAKQAMGPTPPVLHAEAELESDTEPELLDHNYDGIQEFDNPTPGWWWLIFAGSIAFSVFYVMVYHFSPFVSSLSDRHATAEERALQVQFAGISGMEMGETKILTIMGQESWLEQGRAIYQSAACASCHGEYGEGLVGPNMTDEHYKNLTSLMGIVEVLNDGAAEGAMPAQRTILNENEIALVAAYVASLRGTFVEGPRGIEGELIAPWPELAEDGEVIEGRAEPVDEPTFARGE